MVKNGRQHREQVKQNESEDRISTIMREREKIVQGGRHRSEEGGRFRSKEADGEH